MEKGTISEISDGIKSQVRNKFRRSLKEVQLSAGEEEFVRNMICPEDKAPRKVKQLKAAEKVIVAEKENVPSIRRSKRPVKEVTYVESPVDFKPPKPKNTQAKKTATKSKKSRSVAAKKTEQKTKSNQPKLNFSPVSTDPAKENPCTSQSGHSSKISECTQSTADLEKKLPEFTVREDEDSGFDPTCGISDQSPMNSTAITRTPDVKGSSAIPNNISVITAGTPPLSYWKVLAEQRQIALEKTLHENELLHDQLAVLEAENTQLKRLLQEAENVVQIVRAMVN